MASIPPSTLGRYEIIREISRSNDIVYEGFDPVCNRRVAVKEANFSNCGSPDECEDKRIRFRREAEVTGTLSHRNIMGVFDYGEDSSRCFLVLELLDGRSLRSILDTGKTYSIDEAFAVIKPILEALEYAHGLGIVHRDLKPDNIQILTSGEPKLIDFGIARIVFKPNLTTKFVPMGTPSYMSFEQLKGLDIDHRSDLYSVGIILYELISGVKPFSAPDLFALITAITTTEPSFPRAVFRPDIETFLRKSLSKHAGDRFQSAAEMLNAFQLLVSGNSRPVVQSQINATPRPVAVIQPSSAYVPAAGQIIMPTPTPAQAARARVTAGTPNRRLWKHFPIICSLVVVGLIVSQVLGPAYSLLFGMALLFLSVYWVAHNATRSHTLLNDLPSKALLFLVGLSVLSFNRAAIPQIGNRAKPPESSSQTPVTSSVTSSPKPNSVGRPSKVNPVTRKSRSVGNTENTSGESNQVASGQSKRNVDRPNKSSRENNSDNEKPLRSGYVHDTDPEQSSRGSQNSADDEPPLRGGGGE